eukprot:2314948-Prymnesium_polylepis.1
MVLFNTQSEGLVLVFTPGAHHGTTQRHRSMISSAQLIHRYGVPQHQKYTILGRVSTAVEGMVWFPPKERTATAPPWGGLNRMRGGSEAGEVV